MRRSSTLRCVRHSTRRRLPIFLPPCSGRNCEKPLIGTACGGGCRKDNSERKRYASITENQRVEITPRVATTVHTFHGNTLHDHIHDRLNIPHAQTVRTNVRLYQALPGTRISDIARAEGIPKHHIHPLSAHAANALLGRTPNWAACDASAAHY